MWSWMVFTDKRVYEKVEGKKERVSKKRAAKMTFAEGLAEDFASLDNPPGDNHQIGRAHV